MILRNRPMPSRPALSMALALLLPLAASAQTSASTFAQADRQTADTPPASLSTISVIGSRIRGFGADSVQIGGFRDQSMLDTPLTVQVIPRDLLDAQGASSIFDAAKNSAGVTRVQLGGAMYDNLAIRGIPLENRSNYRLNGTLPVINLVEMPLENKARVEVLKGVSALYYGFVSPSGIVNLVTERAGAEPVTAFGLTTDNHGGWSLQADVGRRFGEDERFGARVHLSQGEVQQGAEGFRGPRRFASAALDWRLSPAVTVKLDLEHIEKNVPEPASFVVPAARNGVTVLPSPPDPDRALTNPSWQRTNAIADHALLRTDWSINDRWAASIEIGRAQLARDRVFSQFQNYDLASGEGVLSSSASLGQRYSNNNLRAELTGLVNTGPVEHEVTAGYTDNERYQRGPASTSLSAAQNLYDPLTIAPVALGQPNAFSPTTITDRGVYLLDRLHIGERLQVLAGVRVSRYESGPDNAPSYKTDNTSPSLGVIWALTPKIKAYASTIQGLEEGGTAPDTASNAGTVLPAATSRQIELGLKGEQAGWQWSGALFKIDRPQAYTDASNTYVLDGQSRYQGVELSLSGELLPGTSLYTTATYLDAEQRRTTDPAQLGKRPENAPRAAASVFVEHKLRALPALALNAGATYTGNRAVNVLNQATIPGVTLFSAGASWRLPHGGADSVLRLNVENLADRRYWAAAGNRLLSSGAPRTIKLAWSTDFH